MYSKKAQFSFASGNLILYAQELGYQTEYRGVGRYGIELILFLEGIEIVDEMAPIYSELHSFWEHRWSGAPAISNFKLFNFDED